MFAIQGRLVVKPAKHGLREQKKLENRQRIRVAAADLFASHGYAAATLRQIARRARVALGTLFNYVDDKRDLVFLVFNDDLDALTDVALASPRAEDHLLDQVMAVFACHYRWLGEQPALSRILLQELTFYSEGKQTARFLAIRKRLIDGIERLVRDAQAARRFDARKDRTLVARQVFFIYSSAIRWWIAAPTPNPARGLADLRRLLELSLRAPVSGTRRPRKR
ncbi:MAG: TetR/AcrR family transcriptional regulator [Betaproteobacteria bacterium]|nr:TetR/AcrR family transcriptional regulator [Betaproteobacteria bacterium]